MKLTEEQLDRAMVARMLRTMLEADGKEDAEFLASEIMDIADETNGVRKSPHAEWMAGPSREELP